jgi:hypothetical protein
MTSRIFLLCSFVLLFSSAFSHGFVLVDTKAMRGDREIIFRQIESGEWDAYQVFLPIHSRVSGQTSYLHVTAQNFGELSQRSKESVVSRLEAYLQSVRKTYEASVNTRTNDLSIEPAFPRLDISLASLPEVTLAEQLLSPYAQKWAKKMSSSSGPNCYHTSMASIFLNWKKHRYMSPSEFRCHVLTSFEEIAKPEKWGDLISFWSSNTTPVHGFTFLGPDRIRPEKNMVFTKNGYAQSRFVFMTYDDVLSVYKSGTKLVRYYRPKAIALDPSEDPNSPCKKAYEDFLRDGGPREEANPELAYALKLRDTRTLPSVPVD